MKALLLKAADTLDWGAEGLSGRGRARLRACCDEIRAYLDKDASPTRRDHEPGDGKA